MGFKDMENMRDGINLLINMVRESGIAVEKYQEYVINNMVAYKDTYDTFKEIEQLSNIITREPTIEQLKKQIKYSKNPLEVKRLNRQLNQMYKNMKGV